MSTTNSLIHAPHWDSGRALCGEADYSLEMVGKPVNCVACTELQMEIAKDQAEFETFSADYYREVGDLIQAALCQSNAHVYQQRSEELTRWLEQQRSQAAS